MSTYTFPVHPTLRLMDLPGEVRVVPGPTDTITVTVVGSQAARDRVQVTATDHAVEVTGERSGGGVTVIGGRVISTGGSVRIHQEIGTVAAGQTVVGAILCAGGRIVVDGVDVTTAPERLPVAPKVEVTVPAGTAILVRDCDHTSVVDVAGLLAAALSDTCGLVIRAATTVGLDLSDAATVEVRGCRGEVDADVSGSATVVIHEGHHPVARLHASDTGSITSRASSFGHVSAHASGAAYIELTGVAAHAVRVGGAADVTVNGHPVTG